MVTRISDTLYRIGTNDRKKHLFENNWPLPYGIAYNSYLILDQKTALLDTIEYGSDRDYLTQLTDTLHGRSLDYLIIHHMEPDHAGMIGEVLKAFPGVTIVSNSRAFKILEAYFPVDKATTPYLEIKEGSTLDLGHHHLQFTLTPMVHWPESMMSYCTTDHILFSQDAFGSFGTLDGGIFDDEINVDFFKEEMLRYYANIVGKYSGQVQNTFAKIGGLPINLICPVHGPIWRSHPQTVIELYQAWSTYQAQEGVVIVYASMYGNTEQTADYIARQLAEQKVKNIRIYNVSETHPSFLLREIWKYKGVIMGSCSYNTGMHPNMQHLCHELEIMAPKQKISMLFGGFSWSGGGLKNLQLFADKMTAQHQWQLIGSGTEFMGHPTKDQWGIMDDAIAQFASTLKAN